MLFSHLDMMGRWGPDRRRLGHHPCYIFLGLCRVPGCWFASSDECGDEGAKQGFAASVRVVHELEEAEVERQLVLRDAAVRAQPGAQQGPEALDRVDVDLAEPVAALVAGILTSGVADRLVSVVPGRQAGVDGSLVRMDEAARGDCGGDDRLATLSRTRAA